MASASVVRIGPTDNDNNVCVKLLRNALVGFFDKKAAGNKQPNKTSNDEKVSNTLTISNRYFTAKVELQELSKNESKTNDNYNNDDNNDKKEDGVILVFDSLKSNPDLASSTTASATSFSSLAMTHEQAEQSNTCGDLLRLCVGVTLQSNLSAQEIRGKNHEDEYSRRILWCLDHGYEYVEADLSQQGQQTGHEERDKEGFARIVEAIQGTVWSSAVMSKSKQANLKSTYQSDSQALSECNNNDNNNNIDKNTTMTSDATSSDSKEGEDENPYEPPPALDLLPPDTSLATMRAANEKDMDHLKDNLPPEEFQKLRKDMEAEQLFDQMEGVLREASNIRAASRNNELSDDERRQRAGDAAVLLMKLMDQFGFDEEDDDEDGGGGVNDLSDDDSGIVAN